MNAVVEMPAGIVQTGRLSASEVVQHALVVQEVMKAVMKPTVHYGVIPGTDKPTLFQPGADVLCMTFRIAAKFDVEDLSTAEMIRYRVTCRGVHQMTGVELGSGIGEGSTSEEKYKWRKAVNKAEFEATPAHMRRIKYGRNYNAEQIRTEPADVANTVLKMAAKRAKIAMVLNVTAASDMFGQDLEDLDAALRESLTEDDRDGAVQAARDHWLKAVSECTTLEALSALAAAKGEAVTAFQKSKDTEGYAQFRTAVQQRGAALKAAKTAATTEGAAPPQPQPADGSDFVGDMNAAEAAGAGNA